MKSGRSFYTYARIPIGMATKELQALAEREYEEVGQKDLDRLNVDWARYGELDAAGKLATFIAKRDGVIVGYAAFIVQTHIHYQDALVAANSAVYAVPEVRAGRVVLKLPTNDFRQKGFFVLRRANQEHPDFDDSARPYMSC